MNSDIDNIEKYFVNTDIEMHEFKNLMNMQKLNRFKNDFMEEIERKKEIKKMYVVY